VKQLKVCPNGRYVISGGDKGDVIVYSIQRSTPPEVQQLARDAFGGAASATFGRTGMTQGAPNNFSGHDGGNVSHDFSRLV